MDYLTQNLEKIGMAPALREALESHQVKEPVSVSMKNGKGIEMSYRGVSLYHPEQPLAQVVAEVQSLQGEPEQDLVVYFGLGFGIHAEFLKKKFNAPLLVFEPSLDILKTTLSMRPLLLDDFSVETNFGRLAEIIDRRLELSDRRLIVAMQPGYKQLFSKELERFKFVVQQAANSIMIRQNTLGRGRTWAKFEIENIRHTLMLPPITELKHYCKDVPGVFVGAGPSLSKNIHLIKALKGKALVIAASTALRPLDKAGVQPDIAMVIESNPSTYQFRGIRFLNDLVLAPTPYSNPENFKIPVKYKMSLLNHPTPTHDWMTRAFDNVDSVLTAGSVALAAFSTLHRIGCNPIIALGMDLAYTEGETHVKGADSAAETIRYNEKEQLLEYVVEDPESNYFKTFTRKDNPYKKGDIRTTREATRCDAWGDQKSVFSDITFTAYRAWLEGAAETWASDRILVNATEGGARIMSFEELPLADVLEKYVQNEYPIDKWIEEINVNHVPRNIAPLQQEIEKELSLIRRVRKLAEKSIATASLAIKRIQSNRISQAQKLLDTLASLEKEMGALTRETRILNQISQQAATNIRIKRHEDAHEDMLLQTVNSLKRSVKLFDHIKNGSDEVMQHFEKALAVLSD